MAPLLGLALDHLVDACHLFVIFSAIRLAIIFLYLAMTTRSKNRISINLRACFLLLLFWDALLDATALISRIVLNIGGVLFNILIFFDDLLCLGLLLSPF